MVPNPQSVVLCDSPPDHLAAFRPAVMSDTHRVPTDDYPALDVVEPEAIAPRLGRPLRPSRVLGSSMSRPASYLGVIFAARTDGFWVAGYRSDR